MAKSNTARRNGDDFQARMFWLKAASLLDSQSPIIKVAYETGPKAFDDIQVEYDPARAPRDHQWKPIYRMHHQTKWHTTPGTFGYSDLADADFINAKTVSFLQRARQAQLKHAPDGRGCRFALTTNWRIASDDPLLKLVRKESDAFDTARLFDGTGDKSQMGLVRKHWREHLGIDEPALNLVAGTVNIEETTDSLDKLREHLDYRFAAVGMKRIPASQSAFEYDDLIVKLLAKGRVEFDHDSFREMARIEGLIEKDTPTGIVPTVGIRSFMHPIDNLQDRCGRLLDLVPYFDGRYVRNSLDWQDRMYPELRDFLIDVARSNDQLRLSIDAHVSLAFAVGAILNVKSGKRIELEQRTGGRQLWTINDTAVDSGWPKLKIEEEVLDGKGSEVAMAIGLTHDISKAVTDFVRTKLPQVGRIVHCKPENGPSQQSVRSGHHAWMLAETVVQQLRTIRDNVGNHPGTHIFIAGPNVFAFFLGQHQQSIGPSALYEWDFDGQRGGGYTLGVSVPPKVNSNVDA